MRSRYIILIALLLAGAVTMTLTTTSTASESESPELVPICGVCGPPLQEAAAEHGITVADRPSRVTIHTARNGSAHWTIRRSLSNATATRLQANHSRLGAIVAQAIQGGIVTAPEQRDISINGSTLVVQYRMPQFAHRSAGVLLVEFFHDAGHDEHRYLTWYNDRITVHAPEGMVVINQPLVAASQSNTVRWPAGQDYTHLGTGTFIVFGPDRGVISQARGQLAIAIEIGPRSIPGAILHGLPIMLILGAIGVSLVQHPRMVSLTTKQRQALLGAGVAILVLGLATSIGLREHQPARTTGLAIAALSSLLLAGLAVSSNREISPSTILTLTGGVALVGWWTAPTWFGLNYPVTGLFNWGPLSVVPGVFGAAGAALNQRDLASYGLLASTLLVAPLWFLPEGGADLSGGWVVIAIVWLLFWVGVILLFAVPTFGLGIHLARENR